MTAWVAGEHPSPRKKPHRARVALDQEADDESGHEQDIGEVVGAKRIDELRSRHRFDDVVGGHRQE